MTSSQDTESNINALYKAASRHLSLLTEQIYTRTDGTVQTGPFSGQRIIKETSWGAGDLGSKLLGVYEQDLHLSLENAIRRQPEIVINVGCAEGYYAIGLARRLPQSSVLAFDISESAQSVCKLAAYANDVEKIVSVYGECTSEILKEHVSKAQSSFIFMDCEGAELDLLTDDLMPHLGKTELLIECHDFIKSEITETLLRRLSPTHHITVIKEGPRNAYDSEALEDFSTFDRMLCVCEFRPCRMHWIVASPKS